ncbi:MULTISPECIES: DNA cytosine methyltransferase [Nostocales]|uniref:DNA (Cytosine-5-)-methyltransferase n=1 Tax=Dolichospermum flos-aquae UHCC 0037 TaxID=2590026 RepID=A0ACC7SC12_DOLFA|nr:MULTISPECIES: DNA (cytosine-5-)-methyltransferase [Nostocales]MBO1066193.1 DNA (cytosine-5-)-methyltransferase [Anabaena sp. 54]MTJ45774.1 DNA (cytosine-5-)-methyltransferase [Dolichospermum flos-aquae UHCC 0037]
MKFASFFAGIGGFDLGFERAGMKAVFQCEIDDFCQKILKRHWPHVPIYEDIRTLQSTIIPTSDLWCAGWPCQDISSANKDREGIAGSRSGLFYVFMQLVKEVQPKWLVLENVPGLLSSGNGKDFEAVIDTLEENGYLGGWLSCNARHTGLPHNRDRLFIIASFKSDLAHNIFTNSSELFRDSKTRKPGKSEVGQEFCEGFIGNTPLVVQRRGGFGYTMAKNVCPTLRAQTGKHQGGHSDRPILCGQKLDVDRVGKTDGLSSRMDGRRGRLLGNAIVPIISEWIGQKILEIEKLS